MSDFAHPVFPTRRRLQRAGIAGAGVLAGALVTTTVAALFGAASSTPWLPATPEAITHAAACNRQSSRAAREACMQEIRLAWAAGRHGSVQVAAAWASVPAR